MTQQYRSNDELDEIIRQYGNMVYRIIRVRIARHSDADDVFQEVFIRLVENSDKLLTEEHIKHWLIRVAINCCNAHFRNKKRFSATPYDESIGSEEQNVEDVSAMPSHESSVEEFVIERERDEMVYASVCALPPKYRTVIHLHYYENFSVREIANILKQSESNVKVELYRARIKLAAILKDGGYSDAAL